MSLAQLRVSLKKRKIKAKKGRNDDHPRQSSSPLQAQGCKEQIEITHCNCLRGPDLAHLRSRPVWTSPGMGNRGPLEDGPEIHLDHGTQPFPWGMALGGIHIEYPMQILPRG